MGVSGRCVRTYDSEECKGVHWKRVVHRLVLTPVYFRWPALSESMPKVELCREGPEDRPQRKHTRARAA